MRFLFSCNYDDSNELTLLFVSARSRLKAGENESDMSYSEGLSGETGSETDDRPNSPRAAPVGKDNEMCRTVSVSWFHFKSIFFLKYRVLGNPSETSFTQRWRNLKMECSLHQMFSIHTTPEKSENTTITVYFGLRLRKIRAGRLQGYRDVIIFEKLRVQYTLRPH